MATSIIGNLPPKIQTGEKFRLDLSRTFNYNTSDSIASMTVTVDATEFNILSNKYFDYQFDTIGNKSLLVTVTTSANGNPTTTKTFSTNVVSSDAENLFATDEELLQIEPDLMKMLPKGKGSYHYVHRLVQDRILAEIDERGLVNSQGGKIDAADFVDTSEVNEWAKYYALMFIMQSLTSTTEDIFNEKYLRYQEYMRQSRNRAILRYDHDGDGAIEDGETLNINVARLVRR